MYLSILYYSSAFFQKSTIIKAQILHTTYGNFSLVSVGWEKYVNILFQAGDSNCQKPSHQPGHRSQGKGGATLRVNKISLVGRTIYRHGGFLATFWHFFFEISSKVNQSYDDVSC